jgi:hypothetical protein
MGRYVSSVGPEKTCMFIIKGLAVIAAAIASRISSLPAPIVIAEYMKV